MAARPVCHAGIVGGPQRKAGDILIDKINISACQKVGGVVPVKTVFQQEFEGAFPTFFAGKLDLKSVFINFNQTAESAFCLV